MKEGICFYIYVFLFIKVDSKMEEMSCLICSLPALHKLFIGSGSSQITDALTQNVLQQTVSQTWKGKVLRVESSSPPILEYAFVSSQKLIALESLHLIHHPGGITVSSYLYSTHCMYMTSAPVTMFYPSNMWFCAYFECHVICSFFL